VWNRIFAAIAILIPLLIVAFKPHLWMEFASYLIAFAVSLAIWSESWAATTGTVETAEVKQDQRESGLRSPYELRIAYSYMAGVDWYSGFDSRRFNRESEADEAGRAARGQNATIRYNPRRPNNRY
jgi:hypothetical protein